MTEPQQVNPIREPEAHAAHIAVDGMPAFESAEEPAHADVPIEMEELPDGVRFIIPPPGMGRWNWYGWIWLIIGNLLVISGAVAGIIGQQVLAGSGSGRMMMMLPIWGGAGIAVLIGLLFVNNGLSYLIGRHAIELRGTTLAVTRQSGLIRTRRRVPLARLRGLRVALAVDTGSHADVEELTATLSRSMHYSLDAELDGGGKKALAQWMSYEYVRSLAERLARAIELHSIEHDVAVDPPAVRIDPNAVERAADDTVERSLPNHSDIQVKEGEGELSIVVPKLPLLRGKGGQSVGGMLFSTLGAAAVGIFIFSGLSWFWLLFLAPAGIAWSKFIANRIGERETYIDIVSDTLLVSHASYRGVKQYQWPCDQIKAIRRGKSDLEINDEHLPQLEITVIDGDLPEDMKTKKQGFLVGRSRDEINWIAWRLRQALGVPMTTTSDDNDDIQEEEDEG